MYFVEEDIYDMYTMKKKYFSIGDAKGTVTMKYMISPNEYKPGTILRRIYLFETNGDAIMTEFPVYEDYLRNQFCSFLLL